MGKTTRKLGILTERLPQCPTYPLSNFAIKSGPLIPSNCRFKRIREQSQARGEASVYANKCVAPGTDSSPSTRGTPTTVVDVDIVIIHDPTKFTGNVDGGPYIFSLRYIAGFKAHDEESSFTIHARSVGCFQRIEDAQIGGPKFRLYDMTNGLGTRLPRRERDPSGGPINGALLQSQPTIANQPKRALRSDHKSIRTWTGATTRQTPRFKPPFGG